MIWKQDLDSVKYTGVQMNQTSHIPIEPENIVLTPTSLHDQFVAITEW